VFEPYLRELSLGAGVQSTTVLMLSAEGRLPKLDAAIFSDTGWEPKEVYDHLDRLEAEVAKPAGIPIIRVSAGNIRADALDPKHGFASMPLYIVNKDGSSAMGRRQCTNEYKVKPIKEAVRRLLGAPDEANQSGRVRPGRVPRGRVVEQWIGISTDEAARAKDSDVGYIRHAFPLLEHGVVGDPPLRQAGSGRPGWSRKDCERYLESRGWGSTPKSACIGCPFHGNAAWRDLRDNHPQEWADAVEFDELLRSHDSGRTTLAGDDIMAGAFLHRSRTPLAEAPIDRWSHKERAALQGDMFDLLAEEDEPAGCSPFGCRMDEAGQGDEQEAVL
jgi:hypothetical protein